VIAADLFDLFRCVGRARELSWQGRAGPADRILAGVERDLAAAVLAAEERELARGKDVWDRWFRALALARTPELMSALLAGEPVPLDRLDPVWVGRLGLRRGR